MLLDAVVKSGDVITLKLNSGEELVARFVSETDSYYELAKPFVLSMDGSGKFMLFPYLITAENVNQIQLRKQSVATNATKSTDKTAASYQQMTTNIQKATSIPEAPALSL